MNTLNLAAACGRHRARRHRLFLAALIGISSVAVVGAAPAVAATDTWTDGAFPNDISWANANNWTNGRPGNTTPMDLIFPTVADGRSYLDSNYLANSVTFAAGTTPYVFSGFAGVTLLVGSGGLTQNSAQAETFNASNSVMAATSQTWTLAGGSGPLAFNGGVNLYNYSSVSIDVPTGTATVSGSFTGSGGLAKAGQGTLNFTAAGSYTNGTEVFGGVLAVDGTGSLADRPFVGVYTGGTLAVGGNAAVSVSSGSRSDVVVDGVFSAGSSTAGPAPAALTVADAATLSSPSIYVGYFAAGILTQSGGSVATGNLAIAAQPGSTGTFTLTGGTLSTTGTVQVGRVGVGTFNQSGGTFTTGGNPLNLGQLSGYGGSGTVHLSGGTMTVGSVTAGNSPAQFYFNGGTLRPAAGTATFFQGLSAAYVQAGGASVDTNGYDVTIGQPLLHDVTAGAPATDGGLTKAGVGTLTLTATNTYTGNTTVTAGTLAVGSGGGGSGGGIGVAGTAAALTVAGPGAGTAAATLSIGNGANVNTGTAYVSGGAGNGAVNQSDGFWSTNGGQLVLGNNAGASGTLTLAGGTLTAGTVYVGGSGGGTVVQTGGTFNAAGSTLFVAAGTGVAGSYNLSGGTLTTGTVYVGDGGPATFTQTGGAFNTGGAQFAVAAAANVAAAYNLTGGTLTTGTAILGGSGSGAISLGGTASLTTAAAYVGYGGTSAVTQAGGTFNAGGNTLSLGNGTAGVGTYNLAGGTLTVGGVTSGNGAGTFHFAGGTLRAGASSTTFLQGLTTADIGPGGATIDTNGYDVTVSQNIQSGTAAGTADGGLTKVGAGTLTLTGTNAYTGDTTVNAGTLAVAAGGVGIAGGSATLTVDGTSGTAAALALSGMATTVTFARAYVGRVGVGSVSQTGGTLSTAKDPLEIGYDSGGTGSYILTGGTLSTAAVYVGYAGTGTFNQAGGTVATNGGALYLGTGTGTGTGTVTLHPFATTAVFRAKTRFA